MKRFPKHIVAAGGIVRNVEGEILLVKSRAYDAWEFPGGQIENGESLTEGLKREIMEESGIAAQVDRLVCVFSNLTSRPGTNGYETVPTKVIFTFTCTHVSGQPRPSDETSEAKWVPEAEVQGYITAENMLERWDAYLSGEVRYLAYDGRGMQMDVHERRLI